MGSVHVKTNKGWEEGRKGIIKKASLRYKGKYNKGIGL
jgi:hypothetical protein